VTDGAMLVNAVESLGSVPDARRSGRALQ